MFFGKNFKPLSDEKQRIARELALSDVHFVEDEIIIIEPEKDYEPLIEKLVRNKK